LSVAVDFILSQHSNGVMLWIVFFSILYCCLYMPSALFAYFISTMPKVLWPFLHPISYHQCTSNPKPSHFHHMLFSAFCCESHCSTIRFSFPIVFCAIIFFVNLSIFMEVFSSHGGLSIVFVYAGAGSIISTQLPYISSRPAPGCGTVYRAGSSTRICDSNWRHLLMCRASPLISRTWGSCQIHIAENTKIGKAR